MEPKRIWGIILMAFGAIFVCLGFARLIEVFDTESFIYSFDPITTSIMKGLGAEDVISSARTRSLLILALGIAASVIGTLMVRPDFRKISRKSPIPLNHAGPGWFISGLSGPLAGKTMELTSFPIMIGRDTVESNLTISIPNNIISKRHCIIRYDDLNKNILIEDVGSKNGTFLYGGEKLNVGRRYTLKSGDHFYLADPDILFKIFKGQ